MKKLLTLTLTIGLLPILSACGFEIVDTGHRGVETKFGKVVGETLDEGLHFYNPLTSNVVELDVRTKRWDSKGVTPTKDIQQATIHFTSNYNLKKSAVHEVYQNVGTEWADKLIPQVINGALKDSIGKWDAVDLIANWSNAALQVQNSAATELDKQGITMSNFEITDITFQKDFMAAVENKVKAIQKAQEAQNNTIRIEEEAKQKVIAAKGEAEAIRVRAEAIASNPKLIEYEAVQRWDGVLPRMTMGNNGAVPFISVPTK